MFRLRTYEEWINGIGNEWTVYKAININNYMENNIDPKHYNQAKIQPIDYIEANNLSFSEGNVVKYITRHKYKNGAEDVKKAIQYCKFILKYSYGENTEE